MVAVGQEREERRFCGRGKERDMDGEKEKGKCWWNFNRLKGEPRVCCDLFFGSKVYIINVSTKVVIEIS